LLERHNRNQRLELLERRNHHKLELERHIHRKLELVQHIRRTSFRNPSSPNRKLEQQRLLQ
jgi:hypothetical protein